jgi:hypothetical protein
MHRYGLPIFSNGLIIRDVYFIQRFFEDIQRGLHFFQAGLRLPWVDRLTFAFSRQAFVASWQAVVFFRQAFISPSQAFAFSWFTSMQEARQPI